MDLESHRRWYDYSRARDEVLAATDISFAPSFIVNADDKKRARLNCISPLLSVIPYKELRREPVKLPKRKKGPRIRGAEESPLQPGTGSVLRETKVDSFGRSPEKTVKAFKAEV